jgi:hypothetical protein
LIELKDRCCYLEFCVFTGPPIPCECGFLEAPFFVLLV